MNKQRRAGTERRILGRKMARKLTREELEWAQGGVCGCDPTKTMTMISPPDEDP